MESWTEILKRSAPGAAKLVKPFALSYNDESSFEFTICSDISNPTRYEGLLLYGSNTINDVGTSTNVPLKKYTPWLTPKAEPVAVASSDVNVKTVSPIVKVVLPYVNGSSKTKTSPSGNAVLSPLVPDCWYFIKIVILSTPSAGGNIKFLIVATIPDVWPLTLNPFPSFDEIILFK